MIAKMVASFSLALVLLMVTWYMIWWVSENNDNKASNGAGTIVSNRDFIAHISPTHEPPSPESSFRLAQPTGVNTNFAVVRPTAVALPQKVEPLHELHSPTEAQSIETAPTQIANTPTPLVPIVPSFSPTFSIQQQISPTPSSFPIAVISEKPSETPQTIVVTEGSVTRNGDHFLLNSDGGTVLSENLVTLTLLDWIEQPQWLNFKLKIISAETLVGFDDPCFVVMLNGVPLFGIGSTTYQAIKPLGWMEVSLKLPTHLLLNQSRASVADNKLVFMAGENGDLEGATSIEFILEDFSSLPKYSYFSTILPSVVRVSQRLGYLAIPPEDEGRAWPFFLTEQLNQESVSYDLDVNTSFESYLRWQTDLIWFKDNLSQYGYLLTNLDATALSINIVSLEKTQVITVLPKQN